MFVFNYNMLDRANNFNAMVLEKTKDVMKKTMFILVSYNEVPTTYCRKILNLSHVPIA